MNEKKSVWTLAIASITLLFAQSSLAGCQEVLDGERIFREHCSSCHGPNGEGVQGQHAEPLRGDKSIGQIAKYVDESMPPEKPESIRGEEARAVADYLWNAFYSEIAQARIRPPTVQLMRMTKRQFDCAIADLNGAMQWEGAWPKERGLKGEYRNKQWKGGFDRVDPMIQFRFGKEVPHESASVSSNDSNAQVATVTENDSKESATPNKIDTEEYVVVWQGAIRVEETGWYDFVVKSTNGIQLWVNDRKKPIIDDRVRSGDATEHVGSQKLIGGRFYPIRLELNRSKNEEGSVELLWKAPHHDVEPIPSAVLAPGWVPEVPVLNVELPPDDNSYGYERGTDLSVEWEEAVASAVMEAVAWLEARIDTLADVKEKESAEEAMTKRKALVEKVVAYGIGRELTDEDRSRFLGENSDSFSVEAGRRILLHTFLSPEFLYPIGSAESDSERVAKTLAMTLWDSRPDAELRRAAAKGELEDEEQIRKQAWRMVSHFRTQAKLKYFFQHWLQLERAIDITKDPTLFPGFDAQLLSDLRTSLERTVDSFIQDEQADFRQLLLSDRLFVNRRIADYYGFPEVDSNDFVEVPVNPDQRAGILTHPFLMAGFAYHKTSSPIHRGVFLAKKVLGRAIRSPPVAVAPADEGIDPGLNTRERVSLQTKPDACQVCHTLINPLGFSLEHYDAVGRFREMEKDRPIDATGNYLAVDGEEHQFQGARQLAEFLAAHPDTHRSFVEHVFHHWVHQPWRAYGDGTGPYLVEKFAHSGYRIRPLLVETAVIACTKGRPNRDHR